MMDKLAAILGANPAEADRLKAEGDTLETVATAVLRGVI
jgi:hypothetical protein